MKLSVVVRKNWVWGVKVLGQQQKEAVNKRPPLMSYRFLSVFTVVIKAPGVVNILRLFTLWETFAGFLLLHAVICHREWNY